MKDTVIKGVAGFLIGTTIVKTIKDFRQKRLDKEMYETVEETDEE